MGNYRLFASFRYQDNSQRAQLIASGRALQIGLPPPDFPFLPHIALGRFNQAFTELEIQRLYDAVEEPIR